MSRYVQIALTRCTLDRAQAALEQLGIAFERPTNRVNLRGSLECAGEPVDIRVDAGALGSVEDFGFVQTTAGVELVCGELDAEVVGDPIRTALSRAAVTAAAALAGLRVAEEDVAADGSRRISLLVGDE